MLSVGEVLDFIYTYINMKNKQTNHNNNKNNNKQNNISQGETFSYGVDPETLARWKMEEENGG